MNNLNVPAVVIPVHRTGEAVLLEHGPEGTAGVLGALVAVKQLSGLLVQMAFEPNRAMRSASLTTFDVMPSRSDQPTYCQLNRSMTPAR